MLYEIGHVINGDYGISFDKETGEREEIADKFAEDMLIPPEDYAIFVGGNRFDIQSIRSFATRINRDPGIVLGRMQNDGKVAYDDWTMKQLKHKYKVKTSS